MKTAALIAEIETEIDQLTKARAILTGQPTPSKRGRPSAAKKSAATSKRTMSPEGRARIVAAQKARWAKAKKT